MNIQDHPIIEPLTTPADAGPTCPAPRPADLSAITRVNLYPKPALADRKSVV